MIRLATKYDKIQIIEMMKLFRQESNIKQFQNIDNEVYWNKLLDNILAGQGVVFISFSCINHSKDQKKHCYCKNNRTYPY
jgi:hypothetical protein